MTSLFAINDYTLGLPAVGPNVDAAHADEARWDEAADRAAELMQDAEAYHAIRRRRRPLSLPAELADLIRLAHAVPAGNLTVRPKLLEAIGEAFVSHVEDVPVRPRVPGAGAGGAVRREGVRVNTNYADCWPVFRCQSDAGLPNGPIADEPRPSPARWHALLAGIGAGMILFAALTGG